MSASAASSDECGANMVLTAVLESSGAEVGGGSDGGRVSEAAGECPSIAAGFGAAPPVVDVASNQVLERLCRNALFNVQGGSRKNGAPPPAPVSAESVGSETAASCPRDGVSMPAKHKREVPRAVAVKLEMWAPRLPVDASRLRATRRPTARAAGAEDLGTNLSGAAAGAGGVSSVDGEAVSLACY